MEYFIMAWDHFCPSGFAKKSCGESRITLQAVKKTLKLYR